MSTKRPADSELAPERDADEEKDSKRKNTGEAENDVSQPSKEAAPVASSSGKHQ
jgi:hypothetical protein